MKINKNEFLGDDFFQAVYEQLRELSETASMDELTGMPNRRAGKLKLKETVDRARREKETLTVCLYDINHLKHINDAYGHKEGDKLLKYISDMTKNALQEGDFTFRLSGDEFVIVFYSCGRTEAVQRMQDVLEKLESERDARDIFYEASFCYGLIEVLPGEKDTVQEILGRADERMYVYKRRYHLTHAGKNYGTRAEEQRAESFEYDKDHLYDLLQAGTDDYIFVGNMKTGTFRYPASMVEEFGLPGEIVENAAAVWMNLIHPHDYEYFLDSNLDIAEGRADYHNIEYRARNVKGEWIWLRCRGALHRDINGAPELFAGMISSLGKKNQIDHMTGLYNRFMFEGDIKKYLVDEKTAGNMGIMILDMDSFRNINDLYNRFFGDEVLRITAQKIASFLPSNASIYRLDGDEFGVLVLNGGDKECAQIFGQIQHVFQKQQEYNGKKYFCTLSAGCALCPRDADNYLDLLKYATYSLEESKKLGKNRFTEFSPELLKNKERSLELIELLRESIENDFRGFSVCYQPQVYTDTGQIYGAEALARWRCEKYGEIRPDEFIPLLEQSGLIIRAGAWIFKEAVRCCKQWSLCQPEFCISINMSYRQLLEGNLLQIMDGILEEYGLGPQSVTMELTETYLAKGDKEILAAIQKMRGQGIRIAMDDFGAGYSSLLILKSIPADIVKIDRGFIQGITVGGFNATFISSITQLCHVVGKCVCVEGVETREEYEVVKKMGPELIQGYYFGKPMPASEFEQKYILK